MPTKWIFYNEACTDYDQYKLEGDVVMERNCWEGCKPSQWFVSELSKKKFNALPWTMFLF